MALFIKVSHLTANAFSFLKTSYNSSRLTSSNYKVTKCVAWQLARPFSKIMLMRQVRISIRKLLCCKKNLERQTFNALKLGHYPKLVYADGEMGQGNDSPATLAYAIYFADFFNSNNRRCFHRAL